MEEWHQKLHNNTSPDDVIICQVLVIWMYYEGWHPMLQEKSWGFFLQALIDYIKSDFDISVYWETLNRNGITKERLLSYDRAIHSEPNFRRDQKEGLLRDLGNYMRTLKVSKYFFLQMHFVMEISWIEFLLPKRLNKFNISVTVTALCMNMII